MGPNQVELILKSHLNIFANRQNPADKFYIYMYIYILYDYLYIIFSIYTHSSYVKLIKLVCVIFEG